MQSLPLKTEKLMQFLMKWLRY